MLLEQEAKKLKPKRIYGNRDIPNIAGFLNNIGIIYQNINENEKALEYLNESLEILRKIYGTGDNLMILGVLTNIGNIYHEIGNFVMCL